MAADVADSGVGGGGSGLSGGAGGCCSLLWGSLGGGGVVVPGGRGGGGGCCPLFEGGGLFRSIPFSYALMSSAPSAVQASASRQSCQCMQRPV